MKAKHKLIQLKNTVKHSLMSNMACLTLIATSAFADTDPITQTSNYIAGILFGGLGLTLSGLAIAGAFIHMKLRKSTWQDFVNTCLHVGGFGGAPSLAALLYGMAHH